LERDVSQLSYGHTRVGGPSGAPDYGITPIPVSTPGLFWRQQVLAACRRATRVTGRGRWQGFCGMKTIFWLIDTLIDIYIWLLLDRRYSAGCSPLARSIATTARPVVEDFSTAYEHGVAPIRAFLPTLGHRRLAGVLILLLEFCAADSLRSAPTSVLDLPLPPRRRLPWRCG